MACHQYIDLKKVVISCSLKILYSSALAKIAEYRFLPGGLIMELNAALQGHSKETCTHKNDQNLRLSDFCKPEFNHFRKKQFYFP